MSLFTLNSLITDLTLPSATVVHLQNCALSDYVMLQLICFSSKEVCLPDQVQVFHLLYQYAATDG